MTTALKRTTFETSRTIEYFDAAELTLMTGQDACCFATVALKELLDNALDACEAAGKGPEIDIQAEYIDRDIRLIVSDNGLGLDSAIIDRILNFRTRTSDKAAYRSPTRGAQGNALKTIIGMPFALGSDHPVRIQTRGVEHVIHCWVDPAGELHSDHEKQQIPNDILEGTQITVTLPMSGQNFDPEHWATAFSIFNPHALVKFLEKTKQADNTLQAKSKTSENANFYQPTVRYPGGWKKFLPTDKTSPHWYDQQALSRLIFSHISLSKKDGIDLTLRDFVRQFQGLTSNVKAKKICQSLPEINRLNDFENDQDSIPVLLESMQLEAKPVSSKSLGVIGKEHFQTVFERLYGVKRYWYKKVSCIVDGSPYIFEVGVAETVNACDACFCGINFSPTFEDPLSDTSIPCADLDGYAAYGIKNFFNSAKVVSEPKYDRSYAKAVHLICPSLTFKDRGKTRVTIPSKVSVEISKALWTACRTISREAKQRERDAAKAQREQARRVQSKPIEPSLVDVVRFCLCDAYNSGTNNGSNDISVRDLYYEIRPLIQKYTSKSLEYNYFSQTILPKYRRGINKLRRLYYKPRGVLYEPHSGRELQLGTKEVESYDFPSWLYNKILYIEKSGVAQILCDSGLPERYDMAVISAEGYASEAIRVLLENADKEQDYQIFVWHDADPHGYNIARTIAEETERMPGYSVQVHDLGFFLSEAIEMGLQTETFTRKKSLPQSLVLNAIEREYFIGEKKGKNSWACERVEINAMPVSQRPEYIERKLQEAVACGKVIPAKEELPRLADNIYSDTVEDLIQSEIIQLLDLDAVKTTIAKRVKSKFNLDESRQWIDAAFDSNPSLSWRQAVKGEIHAQYNGLAKTIREEIIGCMRKGV
ncbi:MAG: ATP-binding protein [Desulfobacterales bacterium]|nr:ATP-binding protein [Desulfobacterales bacterium]